MIIEYLIEYLKGVLLTKYGFYYILFYIISSFVGCGLRWVGFEGLHFFPST